MMIRVIKVLLTRKISLTIRKRWWHLMTSFSSIRSSKFLWNYKFANEFLMSKSKKSSWTEKSFHFSSLTAIFLLFPSLSGLVNVKDSTFNVSFSLVTCFVSFHNKSVALSSRKKVPSLLMWTTRVENDTTKLLDVRRQQKRRE